MENQLSVATMIKAMEEKFAIYGENECFMRIFLL
jgi:hypothetical protein